GVNADTLNNLEELKDIMEIGILKSGANILSCQEKQFEPTGVTILFLLSESHFSIHTYPNEGFIGIDCYTCGNSVDPKIAVDYLIEKIKPKKSNYKNVIRGNEEGICQI